MSSNRLVGPLEDQATTGAGEYQGALFGDFSTIVEGLATARVLHQCIGGVHTPASLVSEAEAKRKKILDDLNAQKTSLETRIFELTIYERDYRRTLKDFISGQLKDLEAAPAVAPQASTKH